MTMIKTNSMKAWLLAARPKTLTGAIAPVLLALCLAWRDAALYQPQQGQETVFQWVPALLCMFFAILMQIDANFINDYFDCLDGIDGEERLGPQRACQQGWISMPAMQGGIAFTTCASIAVGLPTIWWGGLEMVLVGIVCIVFAFLYTTWLSHLGLGDMLVILCFGIIPVCVTYYIQLHCVPLHVFIASFAMGLVTDNLLIVNNYRDRETDKNVNKLTLVVRIGANATEYLYLGLGFAAVLLHGTYQLLEGHTFCACLPVIYLIPHFLVWRRMVKLHEGRALNKVLAWTALNIFLYALLVSVGALL